MIKNNLSTEDYQNIVNTVITRAISYIDNMNENDHIKISDLSKEVAKDLEIGAEEIECIIHSFGSKISGLHIAIGRNGGIYKGKLWKKSTY